MPLRAGSTDAVWCSTPLFAPNPSQVFNPATPEVFPQTQGRATKAAERLLPVADPFHGGHQVVSRAHQGSIVTHQSMACVYVARREHIESRFHR